MRASIELAKTEMEARVLGYTAEEWQEYQKSIQPKEEETKEVVPQDDEGGATNV